MKDSPGDIFDHQVDQAGRHITFTVKVDKGSGLEEVDTEVKNVIITREAGSSKRVMFTGAILSEADVTVTPANVDLGDDPMHSDAEVYVGIADQENLVLAGPIRDIWRSNPEGVCRFTGGGVGVLQW